MEDRLTETEKVFVNENAAMIINAIYKQYKLIAVFCLAASLIGIVLYILRFPILLKSRDQGWYPTFIFVIAPLITVLQMLIAIPNVYYFLKGIQSQKAALATMDSSLFAASFSYYRKGNSFSIINCALAFLYWAVLLYHELVK